MEDKGVGSLFCRLLIDWPSSCKIIALKGGLYLRPCSMLRAPRHETSKGELSLGACSMLRALRLEASKGELLLGACFQLPALRLEAPEKALLSTEHTPKQSARIL